MEIRGEPFMHINQVSNLTETHIRNSFCNKENAHHISIRLITSRGRSLTFQFNYVNKSKKQLDRATVKVGTMSFHDKSILMTRFFFFF